MVYSFKRSPLLPIIFLISGSVLMVTALLGVIFGSTWGIVQVIFGALMLANGIWMFSVPIVTIKNGLLYHKKSILDKEDFELKHVVKINTEVPSRVEFVFFNGHIEKIMMVNLTPSERKRFRELTGELINSH